MYLGEIEKLADDMRTQTASENDRIDSGVYALALDPTRTIKAPVHKSEVPYFNFAPLQNALAALKDAAENYASLAKSGTPASQQQNKLLYTTERALTDIDGLPGRPWFVHHIYAPGFYTGYGVKTIPGVREAIEERQYEIVEEEVNAAATVINRAALQVQQLVQ
jgi:N-acetylated-alpha-linked acidic dipeptidase